MKKLLFVLSMVLFTRTLYAQGPGSATIRGTVVTTCGMRSLSAGQTTNYAMDLTGNMCTSASVSVGGVTIDNVTPTGSPVPAKAGYIGINSSGTLVGAPGDVTNGIFVNCKAGCTGGTSDVDDGSIATGQTTGLSLGLNQVFDGTVWRRFTVGVAGTPSTQVVSIQGVVSGTTVPVTLTGTNTVTSITNALPAGTNVIGHIIADSGSTTVVTGTVSVQSNAANISTEASLVKLTLAQGSTTSGQTGALIMGAVTTGSPTYTNAQSSPLSLDTSGSLRVAIISGAGSGGTALADGGTFTAGATSATPISGLFEAAPTTCTTGKACAVGLTTNREQKVSITSASMTAAATPFATRASDGTNFISDAAIGAALSSNPVPFACHNETSPTTIANTQVGVPECDTTQHLIVVGTGTLAVQATLPLQTTGGWTNYFVQPSASDNHAVIKNGATIVGYIHIFNNSATVNYGRLYNAGTGFNGCNSATNLVYQFEIPASTTVNGFAVPMPPQGMGGFGSGLSVCVTAGYATNDVSNATASAMALNIGYN